jgi:hypothetical protein
MMIDFEKDASALTINDDEIKGIAELGKRAKVLQ